MTSDRPPQKPSPLRLAHLTALDARRVLALNPRLLVPVGTLIARGPELPLGCDSLVVDRLADDLSARLGLLRAPLIPFGVHTRHDPEAPGSAGLTRKTLHRMMNELIAGWETEAKVEEVIILTGHAADAHLEALSTIRATGRVTVIDIYAGPLPDAIGPPPHDAALLAAVAPELIDQGQTIRPIDPALATATYDAVVAGVLARMAQPD